MVTTVSAEYFNEELEVDSMGKVIYHGLTIPRLNTTAATALEVWQIRKFIYENNFLVRIRHADGTDKFTKAWKDRATYDYT